MPEKRPLGMSPDPEAMGRQFEQMGFTPTHRHPTKNITRYKQGRINLMLNRDEAGRVKQFRNEHGASASAMASICCSGAMSAIMMLKAGRRWSRAMTARESPIRSRARAMASREASDKARLRAIIWASAGFPIGAMR